MALVLVNVIELCRSQSLVREDSETSELPSRVDTPTLFPTVQQEGCARQGEEPEISCPFRCCLFVPEGPAGDVGSEIPGLQQL